MKTLQEYINQYSNVAQRLGYSGESINILVQLLANASYIEEVENIAYTREASLDKAMLMNSKIQQCMDCMYSVYRGHCPRVVLSVKFLKPVSFRKFDRIIVSTNFSVYYLGEYTREENEGVVEWKYSEQDLSVSASEVENTEDTTRYIVGFMSPKTSTKTITTNNFKNYYIESGEEGDLSNDVQVSIGGEKQSPNVTRQFADHILEPDKNVFDLTTTDYGSRIYFVDYLINKELWNNSDNQVTTSNTTISATFYRYSHLESYNTNELSRIVLKGAEYVPFDLEKDHNFLYGKFGYPEKGIVYIKETERDALNTIHYKANKSRFLNTILRSNSDIGYILEETYPENVKSGGTYYKFSTNGEDNFLDIYYIPEGEALSDSEINNFKDNKTAYYVLGNNSENINIIEGTKWTVKFEITLELFRSLGEDYYDLVGKNILETPYKDRFGIIFDEPLVEEIKTQIGKLDNVKRIVDFNIIGVDEFGNQFENLGEIDIPESVYYKIDYAITTVVRQ